MGDNAVPSSADVRAAVAAGGRGRLRAVAIFLLVFLVYNANGREIASYDSQPTKLAAIELARYHTLTLDRVVLRTPALAERPGFTRDRAGHYRSAYPPLPAVIAAGVASILGTLRLVDPAALLAPNLVAKLTASLLVALAAAFAFLVARRRIGQAGAILIALGFGLGTNLWAVSSQTLWQSETAVVMLSAAVFALAVPGSTLTFGRLSTAALLLGLAAAARPHLAPAVGILAISIGTRRRRAADLLSLLPLLGVACAMAVVNVRWFGHPLGALPRLQSALSVHAVTGTLANPLAGAAGLLVSPSRGLLVFSPIVLVVLGSIRQVARETWRGDLRWWAVAAGAQLGFYACYSMWWGGHTYGPRYCLDLLPLLVPLAAAGLPWVLARRWRRHVAAAALAWSIVLAATGAFVYPHERWNTDPEDVDRQHDRLWQWNDSQFVRCWKSGWSPQNFSLFDRAAVRRPSSN